MKHQTINVNHWGEIVLNIKTNTKHRFIGLGNGKIWLDDNGEDLYLPFPDGGKDLYLADSGKPLIEEW